MSDDPKKLISDLIGLLETLSEQSKLGGVFSSTADQGANAFRRFLSGEVDSLDKAFGVIKCEEHPKITLGEYAYRDQARYIVVQALFPAKGKSKGKSAKEIAAGVYARAGIKIDEREVRRCLDRYSTEILGEILADEFSRSVVGKYPIDDLSDRLVEEPHTENADKN